MKLESEMEPDSSHAATMISACSALGALGRHAEALVMAQRAVDLLTKDSNWSWQVPPILFVSSSLKSL